jgi:hypothetical protein
MFSWRASATCIATFWAASFVSAADTPDTRSSTQQKSLNHILNGNYSFASAEHCTYASAFGAPPMLEPIGEVSLEHSIVDGVLSLNGKGGGTLRARLASSGTAPWFARPLLSIISCKVSYRLNSDSSIVIERECEGSRTMGTGSATASQWTASPAIFTGHVNGDVVSFTDTRQAVERYVIFGGTAMRVCNRIGTATKIKAVE